MKLHPALISFALLSFTASTATQTVPGADGGWGPCEWTIRRSEASNPDGHAGYVRFRREYKLVKSVDGGPRRPRNPQPTKRDSYTVGSTSTSVSGTWPGGLLDTISLMWQIATGVPLGIDGEFERTVTTKTTESTVGATASAGTKALIYSMTTRLEWYEPPGAKSNGTTGTPAPGQRVASGLASVLVQEGDRFNPCTGVTVHGPPCTLALARKDSRSGKAPGP